MKTISDEPIISGDLSRISTYEAGILQSKMNRKLQKFCDQVLSEFGITKMQWLIIGTVYDHATTGTRITDLSKILGTNLPYMTTAVNTLVYKNILVRVGNVQDNRSKIVAVHADFAPKCSLIERTLRNALRQKIYKDIPPEDFKVYMRVMFVLAGYKFK